MAASLSGGEALLSKLSVEWAVRSGPAVTRQIQPATPSQAAEGGERVRLELWQYPLNLRSTFGTSHSSTTTRTNAAVALTYNNVTGYGEIGLPPKQYYCYEADYADVRTFISSVADCFTSLLQSSNVIHGTCLTDYGSTRSHCTCCGTAATPAAITARAESGADASDKAVANEHDPFQGLGPEHFPLVRQVPATAEDLATTESLAPAVMRMLLTAIDLCDLSSECFARASTSGLESAVLDCWARMRNEPVYRLMGLTWPGTPRCSFVTTGINKDIEVMVSSARAGLEHTPYMKVKVDADVQRSSETIKTISSRLRLEEWCRTEAAAANDTTTTTTGAAGGSREDPAGSPPVAPPDVHSNTAEDAAGNPAMVPCRVFAVDANSAWTPRHAMQFLRSVGPWASYIFMLEQPFPADMAAVGGQEPDLPSMDVDMDSRYSVGGWEAVKKAYGKVGIRIYADESMRVASDVRFLSRFVHGVNIKLEKTGGFRGALRAIHEARAAGMHIWLSVMVGSTLNSTAPAHLLSLATHCDLDGSMLTTEESAQFTGGVRLRSAVEAQQWDSSKGQPTGCGYGQIILDSAGGGLGVARKTAGK